MTTTSRTARPRSLVVLATAVALLAAACAGGKGSDSSAGTDDLGDPGNCTVIDIAVSSEKIDLMRELARAFNDDDASDLPGGCAFARPYSKASGAAADALVDGWADGEGERPVIWSPAASSWGAIVEQRLAAAGEASLTDADAPSFMATPLAIAMPKPMADALGYPETPIGWSDLTELAQDPEGWARFGHPEWGRFKLGKTNPNFSTSGLSALVGQNYAAAGKDRDLSSEDLANPDVVAFNRSVESAVVHYGDITMTFLNNWFRTDAADTSLTYVSAVAVEEKSIIDYNNGNPDGVLERGEKVRKPRVPLVAIYPKEGTLYSDNPLYVLKAPWVDDDERAGAERFIDFVQRPANQEKVLEFGFRPGNPDVAVGAPITAANGVDPNQPTTLLETPKPQVMVDLLDNWDDQRKGARVLLVLDVSGSMGDPADPKGDAVPTKLDLAKEAAIESLDAFKANDEVGLRTFTTDLDGSGAEYQDLVPVGPMTGNRERLATAIRDQRPRAGTPLYSATSTAYDAMIAGYDPSRINAVVLLTDGANDDLDPGDDDAQFQALLDKLRKANSGENTKPVRIFPIGYGVEADNAVLGRIAEASNAAAYQASDPTTIVKVFTAVISNF